MTCEFEKDTVRLSVESTTSAAGLPSILFSAGDEVEGAMSSIDLEDVSEEGVESRFLRPGHKG